MKITCITGTDLKGCTYKMKEIFLAQFPEAEITNIYLPSEAPAYCTGCKNCFNRGEAYCPHSKQVQAIWQNMLEADLLVFAYPVYVMRAPGHVKSLLDHLGYNWFAHRPEPRMFSKTAAIITQSIGAPNGGAQKDVKTSLEWLGVSRIKTFSMGLMEGVIWDELSDKKRHAITDKLVKFAKKFQSISPRKMSLRAKTYFKMCQAMQRGQKKKGTESLDLQYWESHGWV